LPAGAAVLGVDEHTAAIIDLDAGSVEVAGRGGLTVRRAGHSTVLPSGVAVSLAGLRSLVRHGPGVITGMPDAGGPADAGLHPDPVASGAATLTEITAMAARRFDAASAARDVPAMVTAILDLEAAISDWAADTEEDQGTGQSRAVLRGLIGRLGEIAAAQDPGQRLSAAAGPLLRLRSDLRTQGLYPAADAIRDALTTAGLLVQDTADGTRWTLPGPLRALDYPGRGGVTERARSKGDPVLVAAGPGVAVPA
jgi:hypothetical protein